MSFFSKKPKKQRQPAQRQPPQRQPPPRRATSYLDHPPPRRTTDIVVPELAVPDLAVPDLVAPPADEPDPMTTAGDLAARRRYRDSMGFLPILLPFMAAKAISKSMRKKTPGEPGQPQGATMGYDGELDEGIYGAGNDATGDDLGYDGDEIEGEEAYGEDIFLGTLDAHIADLEGEEQACGDDVSAEAVGAGRSRKRRIKAAKKAAKQRRQRAQQRNRPKRVQKLDKRIRKMDQLERQIEARQVRREGSALAQQQDVFKLMDDGGAGGPVFGYGAARQEIPGFGTRGEINEIPFLTSEGELEYAEDTIAASTGVRTTTTTTWQTPQVTFADLRLIGVRMSVWSISDEQGLEMRLLTLSADGDKQAIYKTQRCQVKVFNDLGLGVTDFYVRTLRDAQLVLKNTTVAATTNVRQYFDNNAAIKVRTTLTGIFETVRDVRVAASP